MDSAELSEWIAVHTHFMPLPDPWHQTGVIASAALAPYAPRGRAPKASDFVPVTKPPQHDQQIAAALRQLKAEMRGE